MTAGLVAMSREAWVIDAVRTPIGKFLGGLSGKTVVELGTVAVRALLERTGFSAKDLDAVIIGIGRQAGSGPNPARQIAVRAGVPVDIPAFTVNQACGSSLQALILGTQAIRLGDADAVVVGGAESMSRVPFMTEKVRFGLRLGHQRLDDGMYRDGFFCPLAEMVMGETAEVLAKQRGLTREEADQYAVRSHNRAEEAQRSGRFHDEIVPVEITDEKGKPITIHEDEHIRKGTTLEKLAQLPPVFAKDGTVSAGNASGITDGASAIFLVSSDLGRRLGMTPLAVVSAYASAGVPPEIMGIGPVPALRKLFARTGTTLADWDLYELNEAFATQVLAVLQDIPIPTDKLNVNGGAIALGHPIGCTGTRIVTTLLHEMRRQNLKSGIATLCISGGQGLAVGFAR
ncbi:MAG: thiolase family protein [bacterium JZ-2024 1]